MAHKNPHRGEAIGLWFFKLWKGFCTTRCPQGSQEEKSWKVFKHGCPICDQMFFGGSDMLWHIVVHDEARRTREKFLPSQMIKLLSEEKSEVFESSLVRITSQSLGQSCFRLEVFLKWHGTPRPCTISPEVWGVCELLIQNYQSKLGSELFKFG